MTSKSLPTHGGKLLPAFSLVCFIFAAAIPTLGQNDQTQSVADAARAARAKHDPSATSASAPAPHAPFSQLQILAWQIAGVTTPDLLLQLKASGIAFSPDDTHLNPLKDAQLPADLLAVLPSVPPHSDAAASAEVPQALIAASQAFKSKDYASARQALEPLAQHTSNADLFAALGNLDFLSHDLPSAKSAFERAIQLDPAFVYAHVRLAGIYYKLENGSQANAEARKALQLQPDNAEARRYLSLSLSMKLQGGSGTSAAGGVEDMSDLANSEGMSQEAKDLNNQAIQLDDQGDYKGAETAWNKAAALQPQAALFQYSLANLYVKWGGHNVLAENAFQKAKVLAPRNLAIRQNYGHYLCEAHAYNNAIKEFQEILKMDPDWNMARPCLYMALVNVGRKNEADRVLADYRGWNQAHGVPDDSAEFEVHEPRIDDPSGRTSL
jgi:Tfp pilus assembly protein PilF